MVFFSPVLADLVTTVERLDRDAMHVITCRLYHEWSDPALLALQEKTVAIPVMLVALALVAWKRPRRALRATLACLLAVGLGHGLASVMWATIQRPRPPAVYEQHLTTEAELADCASYPDALPLRKHPAHSPSFPSRHALTAGIFVTVLVFASWRIGLIASLYGVLVAYGRVYAGKHWPSDVIVGVLLGILFAWLAWWAVPRLLRRIGKASWVEDPEPLEAEGRIDDGETGRMGTSPSA